MAEMGPEGVEPWFLPAVDRYAMNIGAERPLEALRWAEVIQDKALRENAIIQIARRWREVDESAADAWIEQSPLSAEVREQGAWLFDHRRLGVGFEVQAWPWGSIAPEPTMPGGTSAWDAQARAVIAFDESA